jgi:hypothetical protein
VGRGEAPPRPLLAGWLAWHRRAAGASAAAGTGAVCLRTALFTEVGFYEACNNKVR